MSFMRSGSGGGDGSKDWGDGSKATNIGDNRAASLWEAIAGMTAEECRTLGEKILIRIGMSRGDVDQVFRCKPAPQPRPERHG